MAMGMRAAEEMASQGMKLFSEEVVTTDSGAAEVFKAAQDGKIKELEAALQTLTGKDNKKERAAKGKVVADLKGQPEYVDACKVIKELNPAHGHFVLTRTRTGTQSTDEPEEDLVAAAPRGAQKKEKPDKKTTESSGISAGERVELDKLKEDIIARKTDLKAQGLSGGQQNKDAEIVAWVSRLNELKEKENPGSTKDAKKDEKKKSVKKDDAQSSSLRAEIEVYKAKLKAEFSYTNKDMKADPELQEMEQKHAALEKRG